MFKIKGNHSRSLTHFLILFQRLHGSDGKILHPSQEGLHLLHCECIRAEDLKVRILRSSSGHSGNNNFVSNLRAGTDPAINLLEDTPDGLGGVVKIRQYQHLPGGPVLGPGDGGEVGQLTVDAKHDRGRRRGGLLEVQPLLGPRHAAAEHAQARRLALGDDSGAVLGGLLVLGHPLTLGLCGRRRSSRMCHKLTLHLGLLVQSILLVVVVLLLGEMLGWLLQMMLLGLRGVITLILFLGEVMLLLLLLYVGDVAVARLLGLRVILLLHKLGVGDMTWMLRSLSLGVELL